MPTLSLAAPDAGAAAIWRTTWTGPCLLPASLAGVRAGTVTERGHNTKMGIMFVLFVCDMLYLVDGAWWPVNRGGGDSAIATSTDSTALYYAMYGPMITH